MFSSFEKGNHPNMEVRVPFFDNLILPVTFSVENSGTDTLFQIEARDALNNFLALNAEDRINASKHVYKNFAYYKSEATVSYWSKDLDEISSERDIWRSIQPLSINLERRMYNDKNIYLTVFCSCEWDEEHKIVLVFRQGKQMTRVSQVDGHLTDADAFDLPDDQDELLSSFRL